MKEKPILCDICGQEMKLHKRFKNVGRRQKYRFRRFWCELCDIYKSVTASGALDETITYKQPNNGSR